MPRRPQPRGRDQRTKSKTLKNAHLSPFTVCPTGKRGFTEHEARLDANALYDPELSAALGVPIGAVDRWEEGIETPTAEQLDTLARLTGYTVEFFYRSDRPHPMSAMICGRGKGGGCRTFSTRYKLLEDRERWIVVRDRPDAKLPVPLF